MRINRNAAAVVTHRQCTVGVEMDLDPGGVTGNRLIHGVVDDFGKQMVERLFIGATDIHAGPSAHRFKALQNLDVGGGITLRGVARAARSTRFVAHLVLKSGEEVALRLGHGFVPALVRSNASARRPCVSAGLIGRDAKQPERRGESHALDRDAVRTSQACLASAVGDCPKIMMQISMMLRGHTNDCQLELRRSGGEVPFRQGAEWQCSQARKSKIRKQSHRPPEPCHPSCWTDRW